MVMKKLLPEREGVEQGNGSETHEGAVASPAGVRGPAVRLSSLLEPFQGALYTSHRRTHANGCGLKVTVPSRGRQKGGGRTSWLAERSDSLKR